MSAVIPAAHLIALGFEKGDPPVQNAVGLPIGFKQRAVLQGSPRMPLLVEESMPTLLRALARQHGAKLEPGEVPTWTTNGSGCWWLSWGDPADVETNEHAFSPRLHVPRARRTAVPALTADMGRLEALAAVIEWLVSR